MEKYSSFNVFIYKGELVKYIKEYGFYLINAVKPINIYSFIFRYNLHYVKNIYKHYSYFWNIYVCMYIYAYKNIQSTHMYIILTQAFILEFYFNLTSLIYIKYIAKQNIYRKQSETTVDLII